MRIQLRRKQSPDQKYQIQATETTTQDATVPVLPPAEGGVFLLRKVGILPPNSLLDDASAADHASASEVSQLLNGLPLALSLAGTYMRETRCSFSDYVEFYQNQRTKLLKADRNLPLHQPESATVTCTLTCKKVEQSNRTAANLLRLMAYLSPEAITEEIIMVGVANLDATPAAIAVDKQQLDSACRLLHRYALIQRDTDARTLSVDHLVQAVLKNEMKRKQQRQWAEYAIRAVNWAFPLANATTEDRSEQFLLQALTCIAHINTWKMTFPEAIQLLNQVGYYLEERGLYTEAEPLYQQVLTIRKKTLGPMHPFTAASLNNLATFYERQGKCEQAKPLYRQALTIYEKVLGSAHPTTMLVAEHYANLQEM